MVEAVKTGGPVEGGLVSGRLYTLKGADPARIFGYRRGRGDRQANGTLRRRQRASAGHGPAQGGRRRRQPDMILI